MVPDVQYSVSLFSILLAAALAISIAAERLRLPAAVLLVALGAVASTFWNIRPPFDFGPTLLFLFLPPLIFEAAWNLDLRQLRKQYKRVVFLAFPGTLLSAFGIAAILPGIGALAFVPALLLGAIVSATDPVAVVAVFRSTRVPARIVTIVEAESLANDGVAVVLYTIALGLAAGGTISWFSEIAGGLSSMVLGCVIGALCAAPFYAALLATDASEYEVTVTVALAYVSYLAAVRLGASGIFASATAAIALRALLSRRPTMSNSNDVKVFWNAAAYMTNAVVFLSTGLLISPARVFHEPALVATALLVVLVIRAFLAFLAGPDTAGRVTIFLAGMRGALPLALALAIPTSLAERPLIIDVVFATVLATLLLQGIPLGWVARSFYAEQRSDHL
ncbi:MAG: cation:proton antiporter [Candidatus Eremiobacteraeota bacterium]|nr:cation:proton antiporter [Candidatus Eremiobacteraeota bacterium]